jgi:hypothetical protein
MGISLKKIASSFLCTVPLVGGTEWVNSVSHLSIQLNCHFIFFDSTLSDT